MKGSYRNIELVVEAVRLLGELTREMVFIGGAVVELLLDDPAAPEARPTKDIDVVVETATRVEYYRLQEKLRDKGFRESRQDGVICRWVHGALLLDVMPTDARILGFSNPWYLPAIRHARVVVLEGTPVRIITAPYFLGTKLEALKDRGKSDYMASHDLEDCIAVIDGRTRIVEEVADYPEDIRSYLKNSLHQLLSEDDFLEAIAGHLPPDIASQQRLPLVLEKMRRISSLP